MFPTIARFINRITGRSTRVSDNQIAELFTDVEYFNLSR